MRATSADDPGERLAQPLDLCVTANERDVQVPLDRLRGRVEADHLPNTRGSGLTKIDGTADEAARSFADDDLPVAGRFFELHHPAGNLVIGESVLRSEHVAGVDRHPKAKLDVLERTREVRGGPQCTQC